MTSAGSSQSVKPKLAGRDQNHHSQEPYTQIVLPGVVSHATNLIEHPELIAERTMRFARCVDRENVIAGIDCGLGGRVHAEIAWAKLAALAEGARLASKRLWR